MAPRIVQRNFENFLGVYYTTSDKTRLDPYSKDLVNMERLPSGALRGREGYKLVAQPLQMEGIHTYQYVDDLGVTQEELLGIGILNANRFTSTANPTGTMEGTLFRLKTGSFNTISYTGSPAASYGVSILPEESGYLFTLVENGVTRLSLDIGIDSGVTLKDLADAINAITNFSCVAPKTAIVDGNQSATSTVTVDSGHTLERGDWAETFVTVPDTSRDFREVLATTATTVTFYNTAATSKAYSNNQTIGHGLHPAAILDISSLVTAIGVQTIDLPYYYWEPVPCLSFMNGKRGSYPFEFLADNFKGSGVKAPSFCNLNNVCYISAAYAKSVPLRKVVGDVTTINKLVREDFNAGVWKYDGSSLKLAGPINQSGTLPTTSAMFSSTAQGSGTAHTAGVYKYQVSFLQQDVRGGEIESFLEFTDTHTSAGTVDVLIQLSLTVSIYQAIDFDHFDIRYAQSNGAVSTANTTFTVDAGHLLRDGQYVYFIDNSGDRQIAKIVSTTNTTIVLDDAHTIADNSIISTTLLRVWRTVVSGNEFFLNGEVPVSADGLTISTVDFLDDVSDDDLGFNLSAVKQTSVQYNFPPCSTITGHQDGVLVVGGGPDLPQSIGWQDSLYPESFDRARNIRRVPGAQSGGINQIISNTDNSLIIAKDKAIYSAIGSFESSQVDVTKVVENSYGTSSSVGMTEILGNVIGASKLGLWSIDDNNGFSSGVGEALLELFRNPRAELATTVPFNAERMQVAFDYTKQWLHIFLPREDFPIRVAVNSNEINQYYVIQLPQLSSQQALICRFDLPDDHWPSSGIQNLGDMLFWNTGEYTFRRVGIDEGLGGNSFTDDGASYSWDITSAFDDLGEPEYEKAWHEFFYYSFESDYYIDSFNVDFESYRDWNISGSGYTDTDTVRASAFSFTSAYDIEKKLQFDKGYKAKRRAWKLSGTVFKNPPIISGYGYSVSQRYGDTKAGRDK